MPHALARMTGLVSQLLRDLHGLGIELNDVTLLCATGLHRAMTAAERIAKLGPELSASARIVDHRALDPAELVDLGKVDGIRSSSIGAAWKRICSSPRRGRAGTSMPAIQVEPKRS